MSLRSLPTFGDRSRLGTRKYVRTCSFSVVFLQKYFDGVPSSVPKSTAYTGSRIENVCKNPPVSSSFAAKSRNRVHFSNKERNGYHSLIFSPLLMRNRKKTPKVRKALLSNHFAGRDIFTVLLVSPSTNEDTLNGLALLLLLFVPH